MIGASISSRGIVARAVRALMLGANDDSFTPAALFSRGEKGVWYDPSDFSTLFQDSAGTTPVTALGQSVGLVLDKSKGLAREGELVTNGTFETSAGWTRDSSWTISGGTLNCNAGASAFEVASTTVALQAGGIYEVSFTISSFTSGQVTPRFQGGTVVNAPNRSTTGAFSFLLAALSGNTSFAFVSGASGFIGSIDNLSIKRVPGNHLIQATAASRGILRQDGSGKYYIEFDGTDDGYASAATVNFSATDEITVFAGVRKSSDAAQGMLVELSASAASNNGAFNLSAPRSAAGNYGMTFNGTVAVSLVGTTFAAPITNVVTGIGDISGDSCILRVNGTQSASSSSDQGTGNYGNYTLYVGRRGGTTLPFNGRLYGLIIRGAATDAGMINLAERFMGARTGVSW